MLGTQRKFVDYISVRDGFCHCDEHNRVLDLLMQNKDVFSQSKNDIGLTHVIQHKINTGNAAAIKQAPNRQCGAKGMNLSP
jgi:hypothetical protein